MNHKITESMRYRMLLIAGLLAYIAAGCSDLVPSKYKQQHYTAESTDLKAAQLLSRNVVDSVGRIIPSASYLVDARALASVVNASLQDSLEAIGLRIGDQVAAEDEVVPLVFSSVVDSLSDLLLIRDSLMTVRYPSGERISYALLNVSAADAKNIYLYESLQYNQDTTTQHLYNQNNLNEYVTIQILRSDGSKVSSSEEMSGTVITSSSQLVPMPGVEFVMPTIRARYTLHLDEGTYLVRFVISSPATMNLFKVLILSI